MLAERWVSIAARMYDFRQVYDVDYYFHVFRYAIFI